MDNEVIKPRIRLVERHCPKCKHLMIVNELEECTECHNCGHIDCDDNEK